MFVALFGAKKQQVTCMTENNIITENEEQGLRMPERRHRRPQQERGRFFILRNILNIIFIIGAIVGMIAYFFKISDAGTIIVLGTMAFKMCECVIRLVK